MSIQASRLREAISAYDGARLMNVIGALGFAPDMRRVMLGTGTFPTTTVGLVSWANEGWYALDWGGALGGHCEQVRVSKEQGVGPCLGLPRLERDSEDAGLEVYIVLKVGVLRRLMRDDLFNRCAEWRCD